MRIIEFLSTAGPQRHEGENMFQLAGQIFFGLIIGTLAKLIMPGDERGGVIVTALIGLAGSAAGTFLAYLVFGPQYDAGWILSITSAIAVIYFYRILLRARTADSEEEGADTKKAKKREMA
jgi:uncharacterized membrane protein YeaQ/YmgE (transglycosylase-associated protein family)